MPSIPSSPQGYFRSLTPVGGADVSPARSLGHVAKRHRALERIMT